MKCIIELTQFNIINSKGKQQFKRFLKKYLINTYKRIIINNRKWIDQKLKLIGVTALDLYRNMDNFISIITYNGGIIVSFEKNVYINGLPMLGVIKCLDLGSSVTGTPYPLFTPILKALKRNIDQIYMRFIGLK